MQFSENWLRQFVNPSIDSAALCHLLTMAGLEVEEVRAPAAQFNGVVVGLVLEVSPHPNADKLRVCLVDVGVAEPLQIVCGAPNVAAGMKVPCARVGAKLPGFDIRAAKLRGVDSFGMLCSARELGLSEDHGGLLALAADALIGQDVRTLLDLDDTIITIKLTPNRADCLGMTGIAREVAALTGAALCAPTPEPVAVTLDERLNVKVADADLCGRFSGRVIRGVDARAATPEWMKRRLERAGQRSISVLVDISNYVMLEMNRPNHVFDLDKVRGELEVRWAREGEVLHLLNGQTIELSGDCGVIADAAGVESFAGIMGGESTSCTLDTRNVYVEAAFWWPDAIQGRARRYGFSSEAAHRFERGVDFADTIAGVERVSQLILDICGGSAGPVDDQVLALPTREPVKLRPQRARRVLGIELETAQMRDYLVRLGLQPQLQGEDLVVIPPSFRFDIRIEEDLVEELVRLHGYDNIPVRTPSGPLSMPVLSETRRGTWAVKHALAALDFQEVINFAFVDTDWERDFCANVAPVRLANPIASQMAVMRSSLIGGLVANVSSNRRRQAERVRVFEVGRVFSRSAQGAPVAGFEQSLKLAALAWGAAVPEQWGSASRPVDFYDLKGDLEALVAPRTVALERSEHPAFHPGRCADVYVGGCKVGVIGEVHPQWVQRYELGTSPVVFELDASCLTEVPMPDFSEVSRLPAVRRDLALLVPRELEWSRLAAGLRSAAPEIVKHIDVFDVYQGLGVGDGEKSFAFRIVMQDTQRTLADEEVDAAIAGLVQFAVSEFGARLRD